METAPAQGVAAPRMRSTARSVEQHARPKHGREDSPTSDATTVVTAQAPATYEREATMKPQHGPASDDGGAAATQEASGAAPVRQRRRSGPKSRTSPYLGVTQYKRTGRWEAHLWISNPRSKGYQRHLGSYETAEQAARAYDRAALKMRGQGCELNFPAAQYDSDVFMLEHAKTDKLRFIDLLRDTFALPSAARPITPSASRPHSRAPKRRVVGSHSGAMTVPADEAALAATPALPGGLPFIPDPGAAAAAAVAAAVAVVGGTHCLLQAPPTLARAHVVGASRLGTGSVAAARGGLARRPPLLPRHLAPLSPYAMQPAAGDQEEEEQEGAHHGLLFLPTAQMGLDTSASGSAGGGMHRVASTGLLDTSILGAGTPSEAFAPLPPPLRPGLAAAAAAAPTVSMPLAVEPLNPPALAVAPAVGGIMAPLQMTLPFALASPVGGLEMDMPSPLHLSQQADDIGDELEGMAVGPSSHL